MTTTIHTILEEFRSAATSNRDLGDKFEKLFATYLVTDPLYQDKFSDVWLWNEWPDRGNKPDVGIDLVAKERYTDGFCAIQCKFYDPSHTLQKADIDSFFTASGKSPFTSRIIISTTDKWGKHAEEALENQHVPVSRLRVQDLADSPIDWSDFSLKKPTAIKLRAKKKLRDHQKKALQKSEAGFKESDRGREALRLTDVASFIGDITYDSELLRIAGLKTDSDKDNTAYTKAEAEILKQETEVTRLQGQWLRKLPQLSRATRTRARPQKF